MVYFLISVREELRSILVWIRLTTVSFLRPFLTRLATTFLPLQFACACENHEPLLAAAASVWLNVRFFIFTVFYLPFCFIPAEKHGLQSSNVHHNPSLHRRNKGIAKLGANRLLQQKLIWSWFVWLNRSDHWICSNENGRKSSYSKQSIFSSLVSNSKNNLPVIGAVLVLLISEAVKLKVPWSAVVVCYSRLLSMYPSSLWNQDRSPLTGLFSN